MRTPLYRSRPGGFDLRPASMPQALRINDFIYASHGLSNSYLVLTSEGRVVINTGMGFETPVHKRNFDAVDASPVRYILLTQGHVDHVGGVDQLREAGTRVVAQAGNRVYQDEDARLRKARGDRSAFAFRKTVAQGMRATGEQIGSVPPQSAPFPDLTFQDEYAFELGGLRFELYATPGGETTESMVVWLPQHGILFTGNVFGALWGHIPNLVTIRGDRYRDALTVVSTIEKVMALEPRLVLYGHHEPIEGRELIREELLRLRDAVQYVHDRTVECMNDGQDVWTAMREIELPPDLEVGQGYGKVSWDVRAIWENYLGWFHHHSTTELYPSPPWAAHADLAELAGGPDPIAARARERLEGGDAVLAIRLAEVALAAAPKHRGALQVSLDAHRALESESGNFWLLSWLRDQIERLGRELGLPSS
jgi:alkyl sulfatase BDS1-like metallo-beta-lactamase superfamily hydrolase